MKRDRSQYTVGIQLNDVKKSHTHYRGKLHVMKETKGSHNIFSLVLQDARFNAIRKES